MGKEAKQIKELFQDIVQYVRIHHADTIDKAYTFFWDGENPDEFLGGTALSLGFHNFEDWMVYDYKVNEKGETFIDLFIKDRKDLPEDSADLLLRAKNSALSLYEVASVSKDKHLLLNDILLDREITLRDKSLTRGLKKGDLFATRMLKLDGHYMMSDCVFPYLSGQKKEVLAKIDKQFKRYVRNVKPGGTMQEYLKDYGDIFNLIWMEYIGTPQEKEG
jgi:hypothetical protein